MKVMLKAIKGQIERNPIQMMRGMARDLNISESMMRLAIKNNYWSQVKSEEEEAPH